MNQQEKITTLTSALRYAGEVLHMLSEYDTREMETAKLIAAREARRIAETLAQLNPV